jgi:hypothetical protein
VAEKTDPGELHKHRKAEPARVAGIGDHFDSPQCGLAGLVGIVQDHEPALAQTTASELQLIYEN